MISKRKESFGVPKASRNDLMPSSCKEGWFMAQIELHPDFKDFLKLLNFHKIEYLLVGGYAVGYHGYPRATGDMDVWVAVSETNAEKIVAAIREFGMPEDQVTKELFLESKQGYSYGSSTGEDRSDY